MATRNPSTPPATPCNSTPIPVLKDETITDTPGPKVLRNAAQKSQNVRHAAKDRNSYRGRLYPLPQGVPGQNPRTARFTRGPPSHCGCLMRIPNAMGTNTCATNACRVLEFLHTAVFARGAALPNFRGSLARHPNIAGASQRGQRYGYALNAALEFE